MVCGLLFVSGLVKGLIFVLVFQRSELEKALWTF